MNEVSREILYLALAVLLAGLISVGLVDAVQADQMEGLDGDNGQMSPEMGGGEELYRNPDLPMGLPVDLLFSGHGFAIRGNESHPHSIEGGGSAARAARADPRAGGL